MPANFGVRVLRLAKYIGELFLDFIFPRICILCNNPLVDVEELICFACLIKLPYVEGDGKTGPVARLFLNIPEVCFAHSIFYFRKKGPVQKIVHALKYQGMWRIGVWAGKQMGYNIINNVVSLDTLPDVIIPIPLHRSRKSKRGYNQSEKIAEGLSHVLGCPLETSLLRRVKKTKSQTGLSIHERKQNIANAFEVPLESRSLLNKLSNIMIVDDVITTGATITEAINTLKNSGFNGKFSIYSLAFSLDIF